jgi:hypothetical protein
MFAHEQSEKTSDDYLTPAWVFDVLGLTFDLDVASPPWETHVPALRKFTRADDGLSQEWSGLVWMNPPFSQPDPWVDRFIKHRNGVCLVPMSNGQWFSRLWQEADGLALPTRISFHFGHHDAGIPMRVLLAAFGDEGCQALSNFGHVRVLSFEGS